jgi:hypothetical protein
MGRRCWRTPALPPDEGEIRNRQDAKDAKRRREKNAEKYNIRRSLAFFGYFFSFFSWRPWHLGGSI